MRDYRKSIAMYPLPVEHPDAHIKNLNSIPGFWSLGYAISRGFVPVNQPKENAKVKYRKVLDNTVYLSQPWFRLERFDVPQNEWRLVISGYEVNVNKEIARVKAGIPDTEVKEEFNA